MATAWAGLGEWPPEQPDRTKSKANVDERQQASEKRDAPDTEHKVRREIERSSCFGEARARAPDRMGRDGSSAP